MLEKNSRRYWWRKAVLAEDRVLRYRALYKRVNRLAGTLINKFDLKPQEKVALLLANSGLYPIIYFSILRAGAVAVPLNIFLKTDELEYIINQSNAKILITSERFYPSIQKIRQHLPELSTVVLTDSKESAPEYFSLSALNNLPSVKPPSIDIPADSTAVIVYTSGTTGYPKGAMLTHYNLLSNIKSNLAASHIGSRDRILLVLPMFHSFTMTVCMLMPLAAGAGMVIIKSLHHFRKVFRKVLLYGVTIIIGIPPLYRLMADVKLPWLVRKLLRLRLCVSGAAPLPQKILKKFEENWKLPLVEGYGLSEASPVVSLNPIDGVRKAGSIGLPIPGVEVKIVDGDEAELPIGESGEIIVKGGNVMKGYYNNSEATADALRGEWLFTGDIGRIDKDGYIYVVDRKKDMILVRGLNVYPRQIEYVLMEHPDIAEAAVVGRPDPAKGEVPAAFIIPKEGVVLNCADIIKFCKCRLAEYKVPHQIIIKNDLPRTPTGKILKRELRKSFSS